MEFKDNLYRIRKAQGLSQEELAVVCKVSRQAISKWENGNATPDLENLKTLALALHVQVDELLGIQEETKQSSGTAEKEIVYVDRYHRCWHKEYRSSFTIFGLPLLHINLGRGRNENKQWHVAKGIIAIGNVYIGILSLGMLSVGVISIGFLGLGCLMIGCVALGYFALGPLAIGYIAIGAMAIGVYSVGALAIGFKVAIGAAAYGDIAIGSAPMGERNFVISNHRTCIVNVQEYAKLQALIKQEQLPGIIRALLETIGRCRF